MDKQMLSMEELEQVNGGDPRDWQCPADTIIDGTCWLGKKVADGASWLWDGIKSIF